MRERGIFVRYNWLFAVAIQVLGSSVAASFNITEYTRASVRGEYGSWAAAALSAERGLPGGLCPESPGVCPPSKYRSPTGVCNNVRYPMMGSKGSVFHRLLPPAYDNGVSTPRQSVGSHPLPSGDKISSTITQQDHHQFVTAMLGVWGEFVKRDISETVNSETVDCCTKTAHSECFPMEDVATKTCTTYMRSLPTLNDCQFSERQQMNLASSYLDGSDLYGTTEDDMFKLRAFENGRVKIENCDRCQAEDVTSSLYTVLLLEHNRISNELSWLNPHWVDEQLYEEARRIVVAEVQHITYNEFLPVLLGQQMLISNDLKMVTRGYYTGYSSQNIANTYNGVAVAVLSIFKTMVSNELVSNGPKNYERLVNELASTPAMLPSITTEDVHRSRDHGIPDYASFVDYCSESGVEPIIKDKNLLQNLYRHFEDIDLSVGGLLEVPLQGAIVGPTFACLLAKQFSRMRNSDRFWYENDLPPSSFNKEQLVSLRNVTLAGLLCDNTPSVHYLQPRIFVQPDPYLNSDISCKLQPKLDLTLWTDDHKSDIPEDMIMQAINKAESSILERQKEEYITWSNKGGVDPKSPIGTAAAFSKATKEALKMANSSLLYEFATEELISSLQKLSRKRRQIFDSTGGDNLLGFPSSPGFDTLGEITDSLQDVDLTGIVPHARPVEPECPARDGPEICDERTPFRTHSGYCNNLRNPNLGKSLATFARLLPPIYENGVSKPRLASVTGNPLPSPRLVSTMIHADISNLHNRYSLMMMQFAQFLDHDITFTPVHRGFFASIPDCRSCDSPLTVHPECMPIPIPRGDPHYPQVNASTGVRVCMAFMRSLPGQQHLGPREQINQNSAFIDAAHIYGEHDCQGRDLRSGFGGRMNVTRGGSHGRKDLLPLSPVHPECKAPSGYCFIAGDGRASEQPGLTTIHTIFMREHNRIADGLRNVNPHWDDEILYQHSRRIVSGSWQHLVYNEFLPRLLGWNAINLYGLKLRPQGYYKGYSDSCNPNVVNEFAAAAFRIGHSLLRPHIPRISPSFQPVDPPILLRDGFFNPDMIHQPNMVDEIARGLISTPMEALDQFITGEITNHLFEDRRIPHSGIDLAALNIQRGRDHAIHPYNDYRALCNLKKATTFEDLSREIPQEVIARLKRIYASVDDIDLFPGGMSERPVQGGLVGPTFACIIAIQFRQLRKCDRFWYETNDPVTKFTEQQLAEIRKVTLSKVVCDNLEHAGDVQRSALDQPNNFLNPRVPCNSLSDMDFNAWRETTQGCKINGRQVPVGGTAVPTPCTSCVCTSQGAQCASLRVTDCNQLLREWSRDAVLRDDVCTTQCGFLLRDAQPQPSSLGVQDPSRITFTTNTPPTQGNRGVKQQQFDFLPPPPRQLRRPQTFGFKLQSFLGG